ncbi:MAG TPA: hypothetical protein VI338_06110, partial [Nitrososphaera sp.]|nr:hypothetical protein [Nitrososphaera sp.]
MKVLAVHNRYQQAGGEDYVFAAETALLRKHGHQVIEYIEDNERVKGMSKSVAAVRTVWSRSSRQRVREILER